MAPRRKARRRSPPNGDDGGCLLFLLLTLWALGFVSFHSRESGKAIRQLADVQAKLASAETQLDAIAVASGQLRKDAGDLAERKAALELQVGRLEIAHRELSSTLKAASSMIETDPPSRLQRLFSFLFEGVPGNLVAAGVLAGLGILYGRLKRDRNAGPLREQ